MCSRSWSPMLEMFWLAVLAWPQFSLPHGSHSSDCLVKINHYQQQKQETRQKGGLNWLLLSCLPSLGLGWQERPDWMRVETELNIFNNHLSRLMRARIAEAGARTLPSMEHIWEIWEICMRDIHPCPLPGTCLIDPAEWGVGVNSYYTPARCNEIPLCCYRIFFTSHFH